jgi:polyhydroxyalkanoate synthesis regulator phasin
MKEERILQQLDKMVASGQVTPEEAEHLRDTQARPEFEAAMPDVRLRHAGERLKSAVSEGQMSQQEADEQFERLRKGEHPKGLRARLRAHRTPTES